MNEQEKLRKILYYSDMKPNDCQFIQDFIDSKDQEIERKNYIIKEAIENIKDLTEDDCDFIGEIDKNRKVELLEILEKEN